MEIKRETQKDREHKREKEEGKRRGNK